MPQAIGFYSGLKEGMQELDEKQAKMDLHRERLQEMAMRNQDMTIKSQEIAQKDAENKLMKSAFNTQALDKNIKEDYNSNSSLSKRMVDAGTKMMAIDPTKGIALMKEGSDIAHKGEEDQIKAMQLISARHEAIAQVGISVSDQESLNQAVPELAKMNVIVPTKYRTWNDETKNWIQQQVKGTKTGKETMDLDLKIRAADLADKKYTEKQRVEKAKEDLQERKFAKLRTGGKFKEPTQTELADNETILRDEVGKDNWKDLKPGDKIQAGRDITARAFYHTNEGGITDPSVAYEMAKQEVADKISDGKYEGFKEDGAGKDKSTTKEIPDNATEKDLVVDTVYNTSRGPAKWDGHKFTLVK